jgi:hypothetical protein
MSKDSPPQPATLRVWLLTQTKAGDRALTTHNVMTPF